MGRKSDVARGRAHVSGLGAKTPTIRLVFGLRRSVRERWSPSRGMTTPRGAITRVTPVFRAGLSETL